MQSLRPLLIALFVVSTVGLAPSPVADTDVAPEVASFEQRAPAGHGQASCLIEIDVGSEGSEDDDDAHRGGHRATPVVVPCLDAIRLTAVGRAGPSPATFLPIRASRGPPLAS